jgi:metal-dependent amidase/aminoacylase/carboxypeptidase family protein
MQDRIRSLVASVCEDMGGTGEVSFASDPLPPAYNDSKMYDMFLESAQKVTDKVAVLEPSPGGEDFAYYEKHKPGLLFGLGLRNEAKNACHPAHTKDWDIDEDGLQTGVQVFVQFVLDNMNGFEMN